MKIKLFIYDKFFDAFSVLPQSIQKKTREFMKKFKENPTSNAINYEKITTFKDECLRSVRIDQSYRAIIHAPKEGNNYHLLWVDNHDEAYKWAQNKVFEWNRETQMAQVYEIEEKDVPIVTTIISKPSFMSTFKDEELLKIGVPESMLAIVKTIDNFDDLDRLSSRLPNDCFDNIYYLLDGIHIKNIILDIEEGAVIPDGEEQSINSRRSFVLISEDEQLDEVLSGDFKKWKVFLHPSQYIVSYRDSSGSVNVSGQAGTGKSICAIHRAKYLSVKLAPGSKPILFTTYTKSLMNNIRQLVEIVGANTEEIKLDNIHAFAASFAKENKVIPSDIRFINEERELELWREVLELTATKLDEEFLRDEYNDVIVFNHVSNCEDYLNTPRIGRSQRIGRKDKIEIWNLVENYHKLKQNENKLSYNELFNLLTDYFNSNPDFRPFSHVICDEIQDFSNIELRFVRSLVNEGPNDLFLVGDPLQNIYDKKLNFSKCGINIRGKRSKRLKINYRTTEEIKRLAVGAIKNIDFDDFDGETESKQGYLSLMRGNIPQYKLFSKKEDEIAFVIETIKKLVSDFEFKFGEICIAARTNFLLEPIINRLFSEHIPFTHLKGEHIQDEEGKITVSTFHNAKGLEFKAVILFNVNIDTVPFRPQFFNSWDEVKKGYYLKSELALVYVAMTRAIKELIITGIGEKSDFIKI